MEKNYKNLIAAEALGRVWILHDLRQFEQLETATTKLFLILGYPKNTSEKMSKHITDAYYLHAEIDDFAANSKLTKALSKKIKIYEKKIAQNISKACVLAGVGDPDKLASYHSAWWMNFLKRNITKNPVYHALTFWNLFAEQKCKLKHFFPALKATYWLFIAGYFGHSKRKKEVLTGALARFWSITLAIDKKPLMF